MFHTLRMRWQRIRIRGGFLLLVAALVMLVLHSTSAHAASSHAANSSSSLYGECTTRTLWSAVPGESANNTGSAHGSTVTEAVTLQGLYDATSKTFCGQLRATGTITTSGPVYDTYEVGLAPPDGGGTYKDVAVSGTGTWPATTPPITNNCISFVSGFLTSLSAQDGDGAQMKQFCVN